MPISISWSRLQTHEMCRQQAYLISAHKKNPAADVRGYFHGRVVDRVMRTWLDDPVPGAMPGMVADFMVSCEKESREEGDGVVRWKHRNDRAEVEVFCVELVRRLEPLLTELVLPHEYEPARRFKVPVWIPWLDGTLTEIYLVGETDILVRDDQARWAIWDLKGTKDDSYWRKTMAQLLFYDIALEAEMGQGAHTLGLIQPMCKEPKLEFTFSEDDRAALWQRIMRMASDMWQHDHAPKPSNVGCNYCPVRHACAKFAPVNPRRPAQSLIAGGVSLV